MIAPVDIPEFEVVLKFGRLIADERSLASNLRWIAGSNDKPPLDPPGCLLKFDAHPKEYRDELGRMGWEMESQDISRMVERWKNEQRWYMLDRDHRRRGALAHGCLISAPSKCPEAVFRAAVTDFFEHNLLDFELVACLRSDKPHLTFYFTMLRLFRDGNQLKRVSFNRSDLHKLRKALALSMCRHGLPATANTRRERGLDFAKKTQPWKAKP